MTSLKQITDKIIFNNLKYYINYIILYIFFFSTKLKDLEEQSRNANEKAAETAQQVLINYMTAIFNLLIMHTFIYKYFLL